MTTPLSPLAIANTESLVEHSPSTVMALNVSRTTALSACLQQRGLHLRVTGEKPQHRRHHRLDHAGALRHAADMERACWRLDSDRRLLRKRIGRHDGQRGVVMPVAAQSRGRRRDAAGHLVEVEIDADNARGRHEDFLGAASEQACDELHRRARHLHAGVARAGVCASAVADDGARASAGFLQILARNEPPAPRSSCWW